MVWQRLRRLLRAEQIVPPQQPDLVPDELLAAGLEKYQAGDLAAAEDAFRQLLSLSPAHPGAAHHLGILLAQRGDYLQAEPLLRSATLLEKANPACFINLGNVLRNQGRFVEAAAAYRRSIAIEPLADAYFRLGSVLLEMADPDPDAARQCYQQAIELRPDFADAYSYLAYLEQSLGHPEECIRHAERALSCAPGHSHAHVVLGEVLHALGRIEEAVDHYRMAISRRADYAVAYCDLGNALRDLGRLDESLAAYDRALEIQPELGELHWNRALSLLESGDFEQGWTEYEYRFRVAKGKMVVIPRSFSQPAWSGDDLQGRSILIQAEQGFGDCIQFARYVPLLAARGATVHFEVQPELGRLMRSLPGVSKVVSRGTPLPSFEVHCPLLSLPNLMGTRLESIPCDVPYLSVPPDMLYAWSERVRQDRNLRVGLVWSSNVLNRAIHASKSVPLDSLRALWECADVTFYSLQKGAGRQEIAESGVPLVDWSDELTDFSDTAALIANLDLVISVDTAVAHLAGALGKPVWMFVWYGSDWRWMWGRDDSPWYPSMRLFRQRKVGDWSDPVARLREAMDVAAREFSVTRRFSNAIPSGDVKQSGDDLASTATESAEALKNSGNAAYAKWDLDQAEKYYRQAISVKADYAEAHNNLGLVLSAQKKYPEAEKHLQRAVSLNPRLANAHFNLGLLFVDMAIPTAAIEHFRRTIALDPDYVDAYLELANLLEKMGQIDEAEMNLRTALALNPQSAKAYGNLAKIFNNRGDLQDAQGLARKSIEIDPSFAFGHNVLGVILQGLDRIDEAMAEFQKAVSLDPELNTAKYNLAQPLMLHGDYDKGLALYESRFDAYREVGRSYHLVSESLLEIVSRIPCWQGESLEGRRLLVWEEQGFGDTLMMLRYLPLLLEKGLANITVRCSPVLVRLVRSMPIAEHLQVIEMLAVSTEHFDFHCSLMSLPHRFGTRPETIPTHVPYLTVPEVELAKWQNRLAGLSGLKVGLVWLGNPDNPLDAKRSITLAQLAPALATRGVSFISLQKGGTSSLNSMGNNSLHDWMDECADFLDTAALIENLDLVIAVDTAVAHLGGALGKPVWLLNRRNTDWRWFLDREDSPWYPTLRIFRQTRCGEWDDVIRRVALELGELASG